ncbi:hypothetical protein BY996DRAFT_6557356 [Phakopsora pachyrhizi]|nr:hypothetical protein BY996DRAFT_6557356 [Phakopsora pachyrhizi]
MRLCNLPGEKRLIKLINRPVELPASGGKVRRTNPNCSCHSHFNFKPTQVSTTAFNSTSNITKQLFCI